MTIEWNQVKEDFSIDGSLRDIYFFNTDIAVWQKFLDSVKVSSFNHKMYRDGESCTLSLDIGKLFLERENSTLILEIEKHGVIFNCHFFVEEEIELDISPKEITNQEALNVVLEFMQYFSNAINLPCVLTPENSPEMVIIQYDKNLNPSPVVVI
jgi:hypothetical protein